MSTRTVDEIVERADTLPQLPNTTLRLIRVVNDPDTTLDQIVDTIRYDQTVTTEILRRCNSAYFGLPSTVSSVDDAVRYLGTAKVLQLVMAAHTQALLTPPQEGYGLRPGALWTHSVGVALAAQTVAKRLKLADKGVLFTAGLLHDVGKVLLNEFIAAEYAEIARRVAEQQITFTEAEQQVLGFTHPEIGGRVAERWNLPEPIRRCIRYHHEPGALPAPDVLVDAVHLADAICLLTGVGAGDESLLYRADPDVVERHELNARDLEHIGADTVVELKAVESLFAAEEGT